MSKKLPIRHIGYLAPICGVSESDKGGLNRILRQDLGVKRYRQMGVRERYKGEKPYRVCKRCIATIDRRSNIDYALKLLRKVNRAHTPKPSREE